MSRGELVRKIRAEADEAENANYHALCAGMNKLADAVERTPETIGYFAFVTFDEIVREFTVHSGDYS